jgi:hypothetical protein
MRWCRYLSGAGSGEGLCVQLTTVSTLKYHHISERVRFVDVKARPSLEGSIETNPLLLPVLGSSTPALPGSLHSLLGYRDAQSLSQTKVSFYLLQIIPQAICSKYGLAIGASISWFVWGLMGVCFVIAWPISKVGQRPIQLVVMAKFCFHCISRPVSGILETGL